MVRTLIGISQDDKQWLERYSHSCHQSMAQTIRLAIQAFRQQNRKGMQKNVFKQTAGLWKGRKIDSQEYVQKLRKEWDGAF